MSGEADSQFELVSERATAVGKASEASQYEMPNQLRGLLLRDAGDWRTLSLIFVVQAGILALLFLPLLFEEPIHAGIWSTLISIIVLAPLMTLYSSLQHEVLHGHPFSNQTANDLLVTLPLAVIVPYYRFKDTHLAHHKDVNLCDPYDDPETWYQFREEFEARSQFLKAVFKFNNSLFGRMLIGPIIGMIGFGKCDWRQFRNGTMHIGWKWGLHVLLVGGFLALVSAFSWLPVWAVWVAAYLGMSLLMVRTFIEHQAHEKVRARSVIIEKGGLFAFLFLNNSLHAVHHAYPAMAWYRLPMHFEKNRERFLKLNDGYRFSSYLSVFQRFIFTQKEPVSIEDALDKRRH